MATEQCPVCDPVTRSLPILHLAQRNAPPEQQSFHVTVNWTPKLSDLVSAAKQKCAFCTFVADGFFHCNRMWLMAKYPKRPWFRESSGEDHLHELISQVTKLSESLENDQISFKLYPSHSSDQPIPDFNTLEIVACPTEHHSEEDTKLLYPVVTHLDLEVFALGDDPVSDVLTTRPPQAAPGSTESFDTVRSWLHDCIENHPRCGLGQGSFFPTRVIDVGDGNNLRLETSRIEGKYAALSYCWGGPQQSRTLTKNLDQRMKGFEASELEQTLQDAVKVTRELGLKYLWTDAQCILQDSEQDKAQEIREMSNIYKHAHITICAASADNVSKGFLEDSTDEETGLSKDLFPMQFRRPAKTATTMKEAFNLPPDGFSTLWVRDKRKLFTRTEPVMMRAWTLQERLLSPRFLHYGTRLIWECNTLQRSDGGVETPGQDMIDTSKTTLNRALLFREKPLNLFNQQQLFDGWYEIVRNYTKRSMSDEGDKLPAIGGIATEINRLSGMPYIAGLWKNNLLHDLMWTSNVKERFTRPDVWRAPSWSWASVDSVVTYEKITPDAIEEAEVLDCQVETALPNYPLGAVKSGKLEICGPLALIPLEDIIDLLQLIGPAPPESNDVTEWHSMIAAFQEMTSNLKGHNDEKDNEFDFDEIYCLITHSRQWKELNFGESRIEKTCYFGLILGKNVDGNFERLGSFDNEDKDWMKNCTNAWERQTITLV